MGFLRHTAVCVATGMTTLALGCTSFPSRMYMNNNMDPERKVKHLKGIPTTLEVPTHLKVAIVEKQYFLLPPEGVPAPPPPVLAPAPAPATDAPPAAAPAAGTPPPAIVVAPSLKNVVLPVRIPGQDCPVTTRTVDIQLQNMKELYMVDFKRPAAGKLTNKLDFTGQYITKIDYKVEDLTIEKVAALLQTVISKVPTFARFGTPTGTVPAVVETTKTIAYQVFDLRDPAVEAQVAAFIATYVNNCTPPCDAVRTCPTAQTLLGHPGAGR